MRHRGFKLPRLRAELVAVSNCKCRPCAIMRVDIEARIRDIEAVAPPAPPPDDGLDPLLLSAGIKAPKAKRSIQLGPAERIRRAKRFARMNKASMTVEGKAREQTFMDRASAWGKVVRG